jgi:hypothetical protein
VRDAWLDAGTAATRTPASDIARQDPPSGITPEAAAGAIAEVLDSIGDTCPECLPKAD